MIFVLSALHPDEWAQAIKNVWDVRLLFLHLTPFLCRLSILIASDMTDARTGRNHSIPRLWEAWYASNEINPREGNADHSLPLYWIDMTQLRFKKNRLMQPGLYVRGDHTRVYFFERGELIDERKR